AAHEQSSNLAKSNRTYLVGVDIPRTWSDQNPVGENGVATVQLGLVSCNLFHPTHGNHDPMACSIYGKVSITSGEYKSRLP
ncbi:MAG: hypothetical protein RLN85_09460, partial [Pseudomonadales bacterium]